MTAEPREHAEQEQPQAQQDPEAVAQAMEERGAFVANNHSHVPLPYAWDLCPLRAGSRRTYCSKLLFVTDPCGRWPHGATQNVPCPVNDNAHPRCPLLQGPVTVQGYANGGPIEAPRRRNWFLRRLAAMFGRGGGDA